MYTLVMICSSEFCHADKARTVSQSLTQSTSDTAHESYIAQPTATLVSGESQIVRRRSMYR